MLPDRAFTGAAPAPIVVALPAEQPDDGADHGGGRHVRGARRSAPARRRCRWSSRAPSIAARRRDLVGGLERAGDAGRPVEHGDSGVRDSGVAAPDRSTLDLPATVSAIATRVKPATSISLVRRRVSAESGEKAELFWRAADDRFVDRHGTFVAHTPAMTTTSRALDCLPGFSRCCCAGSRSRSPRSGATSPRAPRARSSRRGCRWPTRMAPTPQTWC